IIGRSDSELERWLAEKHERWLTRELEASDSLQANNPQANQARNGTDGTPSGEAGLILIPASSARFSEGFKLEERLGAGGNAVVYKARLAAAREGEEWVAVKLFAPSPSISVAMTTLGHLAAEQSLHRLTHPGIVRILTAGDSDRGPFIALEWVPGENLKEWVKRNGPVDHVAAARVVAALANAVEAIHRRPAPLIHRDIKPANILGCRGPLAPADSEQLPKLKLGDFGSAHELAPGMGPVRVEGTPGHMPPEQLRGEEDRTADVYALGILLVFLLTGKSPTDGTDESPLFNEGGRATLRKVRGHLSGAAGQGVDDDTIRDYARLMDPEAIAGQIPAKGPRYERLQARVLQSIVKRCLATNPAERYPGAADLQADLDRFARDCPATASGHVYGFRELLAMFSRRCARPEYRFEEDRLSACGLAFLALAFFNLLAEGADHALRSLGLTIPTSNAVCSGAMVVVTLSIAAIMLTPSRIGGRRIAVQAFTSLAAFAFAAGFLVGWVLPDNIPLLTTVLWVLCGCLAALLGSAQEAWKHTRTFGFIVLVFSPAVWSWSKAWPATLEQWGPSLMGAFYVVFYWTLGAGYVSRRRILRDQP
ncbi:MAG: serine/threonine protein kinase, partial [Gemmataceae bacterium]